jgi:hypothetical protein
MNLFPDIIAASVTFGVALKGQITPASIAMLGALAFCMVVVWRWAKGRMK